MNSERRSWHVPLLVAACLVVAAIWGVVLATGPQHEASQGASSEPVIAPEPVPEPASLAPARRLLASGEPVTISVLGDSTGNASTEWVGRWAATLGQDHRVEMHLLDPDSLGWIDDTWDYGSVGAPVTIWNAGVSGETADYPTTRLDELAPQQPDLVVYSFGHNNDSGTIGPEMDGLTAAVSKRWPDVEQVAVLQNPGLGDHGTDQEQTIDALRAWALDQRVPIVDVYAAFMRQPALDPLILDDRHPDEAGSALWAQTMAKALG